LTHRLTANRAARPVTFSKLHELLRNRYYPGFVTQWGLPSWLFLADSAPVAAGGSALPSPGTVDS